ncbi:MAG TPA: hypothetical protein VET30_08840 [Pseudoxanthomonas sp.]|nr:hypothetical protein [Pseudoxanthomonas sp.]
MIRTVWPALAIMLLAGGIFPALEPRFGWRFFSVLSLIAYRPARVAAELRCAPAAFRSTPFRAVPVRYCIAGAHWRRGGDSPVRRPLFPELGTGFALSTLASI